MALLGIPVAAMALASKSTSATLLGGWMAFRIGEEWTCYWQDRDRFRAWRDRFRR